MTQNKPFIINEFFKRKGINWNCPICDHQTNLVPDDDTAIMIRRKNVVIGNFFPVQIIECAKCGFIGLFNLRVLGLLNDKDKKSMSPVKIG